MKIYNLAALVRNTVAVSLALTLFISSSMFVMAKTSSKQRLIGELTVSGAILESDAAFVTIDGERAMTGRSVLPSSNITTQNIGAIVSLGEAGRVEIAADSSVNLEFTENSINAHLAAGQVKIFNAAGVEAKVVTANDVVTGKAGVANSFVVNTTANVTNAFAETGAITRSSGQTTQDTTTAGGGAGLSSAEVLVPVLILVGITAVAVVYVLTKDDDELNVVVSPVR